MEMTNLKTFGTILASFCLAFVFTPLIAQEEDKATGEVNACTIITEQDMGAILGEPVKQSERTLPAEGLKGIEPFSECRFTSSKSDVQASILIRQGTINENEPAEVRNTLESMGEVQDVSGVGDKAYWGSQQLNVFRGKDLYLVITVSGMSDEVALEKAKAIAQKVLKRIP